MGVAGSQSQQWHGKHAEQQATGSEVDRRVGLDQRCLVTVRATTEVNARERDMHTGSSGCGAVRELELVEARG